MSSNSKKTEAIRKNKVRKSGAPRRRALRAAIRKAAAAKIDVL